MVGAVSGPTGSGPACASQRQVTWASSRLSAGLSCFWTKGRGCLLLGDLVVLRPGDSCGA